MNRRREFAVFALRPGRLPAGPGDVTGCGRLHPQHSPACTAVPRTGAYRRDSPSSQWEAVVEVSLSPRGIVAHLPPRQGQRDAWIAPACAIVAPPRSPLHRAGIVPVTPRIRLSRCVKGRHWNSLIYQEICLRVCMGRQKNSLIIFLSSCNPRSMLFTYSGFSNTLRLRDLCFCLSQESSERKCALACLSDKRESMERNR